MNPVGMVQRDSNDRESSASVGALACRGEQIKDREKKTTEDQERCRIRDMYAIMYEICMIYTYVYDPYMIHIKLTYMH